MKAEEECVRATITYSNLCESFNYEKIVLKMFEWWECWLAEVVEQKDVVRPLVSYYCPFIEVEVQKGRA